jgi:hypothetical protein
MKIAEVFLKMPWEADCKAPIDEMPPQGAESEI